MKLEYRECEIKCFKDKAMSGETMMFYSIFTKDGFEISSGFTSDKSNSSCYANGLKEIVDDYYENPSEYE